MASEREVRKLEKQFSAARDELLEYMADHEEVFNTFFSLVEKYNITRKDAIDAFRSRPGTEQMSIGCLDRSRAPETWDYAPHQLPSSVLKTPGVVKSIDNRVVEQGIVAGTFDADLINSARTKKHGTPRVSAPKEVVLKVG